MYNELVRDCVAGSVHVDEDFVLAPPKFEYTNNAKVAANTPDLGVACTN